MPSTDTRSPLRDKPLRLPGQSLDEQINDLIYDKLIQALILPLLATLLAGLEWWRLFHPAPPAPWPLTVWAIAALGRAAWTAPRMWRQLHILKLGRDGERVVGQQLEELRAIGCHILHDIQGPFSNIDHAAIAISGVYAIETKTHSVPVGRKGEVRFDGTKLLVDGVDRGEEILGQAAAERADLRKLIKDVTGMDVPVRSVILFPGRWIVHEGDWRRSGVWVLNPEALAKFIARERTALRPEELSFIRSSLTAYIHNWRS